MELTPAQRAAADGLLSAVSTNPVLVLRCDPGMGRSTILETLRDAVGGTIVRSEHFMAALMARVPSAIEETFFELMDRRLEQNHFVFLDDFHLIRNVVRSYEYPRQRLIDAGMAGFLEKAATQKKTVIFAVDEDGTLPSIHYRAAFWKVDDFGPADYALICRHQLTNTDAERLDFSRIHRFAPALNIWQLKNVCLSLSHTKNVDTDHFVDYLTLHNLVSNVELDEVRPVKLSDIKGLDDVIQALEAKIALPFENPVLAAELDLKPRRGVLLSGPPGTGKTTVGRALAHRLKGKFFLIDGTAVSGTDDFYEAIGQIFDAAKRNAPSIVFIDDADVMFGGSDVGGLYRYFLTELDGLQSLSAARVCVMMTAMDPANLPAALLRSGRIELWLETRLPNIDARTALFEESLKALPRPMCEADCALLASASHGLTGADLRSLIEDGKLGFAHDKATGKALRPINEYFLDAIQTVRQNRRSYGKRRPSPFKDFVKIGFDRAESA